MTRIPVVPEADISKQLQEAVSLQLRLLGLVPESLLTMAHRPRMAAAFAKLASEVMGPGTVRRELKQLVAYVASSAAGCRYCQAHTAHGAEAAGADAEKIRQAHEFETSDLFADHEREALRLARDAAVLPNAVTDEHFDRLRESFTDEQIAELVGVIALFGWLNRWNDTMATTLETSPRGWAEEKLRAAGWTVGKHVHP